VRWSFGLHGRRDEIPRQVDDLLEDNRDDLEANDLEAIRWDASASMA
jgi:hypothetical protein